MTNSNETGSFDIKLTSVRRNYIRRPQCFLPKLKTTEARSTHPSQCPGFSLSVPLFSLAWTECQDITKEKCGTVSLNASSFRWFRILRGYATLSEKRQERIGRAVADVWEEMQALQGLWDLLLRIWMSLVIYKKTLPDVGKGNFLAPLVLISLNHWQSKYNVNQNFR